MPPRPGIGYSFGPGPMTPAVRAIIYTNVAVFVVTLLLPGLVISTFGLSPALVIEKVRVWQLVTYLFVHSPSQFSHILFNMLSVWMFGVDLERRVRPDHPLRVIGGIVNAALVDMSPEFDALYPATGRDSIPWVSKSMTTGVGIFIAR